MCEKPYSSTTFGKQAISNIVEGAQFS